VTEVVYDPRFFEVPARMLEDEGLNMVEFPQSVERMAPACGTALQMIVAGAVVHDADPDLTAHVTSAAIRPGERGFTLSKGKSKRKIDACIAMVIALTRVTAPAEKEVIPWAVWV
jgi:phage terminase large subunit-like protein